MARLVFAVGTRPDIVKVAPVLRRLPQAFVVSTGQHYSHELAGAFLAEFGVRPDLDLTAGHRGSAAELHGPLVSATTAFCRSGEPGMMVVYGDTLSAAAVALGAVKAGWPVAHIEAGLRSGDLQMPEEVARMMIDSVSDLLFAPTEAQAATLLREGTRGDVHVVGNTIQDVLGEQPKAIERSDTLILTLHRRENHVHAGALLRRVLAVAEVFNLSVIFPVHPGMRTLFDGAGRRRLKITAPVPHAEMVGMVGKARLVMTDSGGLQEECALLGTPCVTLRRSTERPETVEAGWNRLMHPELPGWDDWTFLIGSLLERTENLEPFRYSKTSPAEDIAQIMLRL